MRICGGQVFRVVHDRLRHIDLTPRAALTSSSL